VTSPDRGTSVRRLRDETRVVARTGGTIVECLVQDGDLVSPRQPLLHPHPEGDAP
jgi:[acyl-carrier-protein] S-malonyltransferase